MGKLITRWAAVSDWGSRPSCIRVGEGRLQVKRHGVMHGGGIPFLGFRLNHFAVVHLNGVLRIHGGVLRLDVWSGDGATQKWAVACAQARVGIYLREPIELRDRMPPANINAPVIPITGW